MPESQPITVYQGQAKYWTVLVAEDEQPRDITGWAFDFVVQRSLEDKNPPILQKSVGSGITILAQVGEALGLLRIDFTAGDTYNANAPAPGNYRYSVYGTPIGGGKATIVGASVFIILPSFGYGPLPVLPDSVFSTAEVRLVDGSGRPLVGRRVIFVAVIPKLVTVTGATFAALPETRIVTGTNQGGFAQQKLLRGQNYKVFFEGSSFSREFVVPEIDNFDLLQLLSTQPDPFAIVQTPSAPIRMF